MHPSFFNILLAHSGSCLYIQLEKYRPEQLVKIIAPGENKNPDYDAAAVAISQSERRIGQLHASGVFALHLK